MNDDHYYTFYDSDKQNNSSESDNEINSKPIIINNIEKCEEYDNKAKNCILKFDILDEDISFVKCNSIGKPIYRWCVNCKKYNEERDRRCREMLAKYEEEQKKDNERQQKEWNFAKLSKNQNFINRLLEKKDDKIDERICLYEKYDKNKQKLIEEKIKKKNDAIKRYNNNNRKWRNEALAPYINKPIPIIFKNHYNEYMAIKCVCKSTLCFPQDFEDIHKYFNFNIPKKYYNLCIYFKGLIKYYKYFPNYCNKCFKKKLEMNLKWKNKYNENHTYFCSCGKVIFIPYKKTGLKWKNEIIKHEESNYIHLLYLKEFDTFYEIKNKLGFNLFIRKRNELEEFVINNNINFKILENMNAINILEGLIDLFRKNNKSFPIKNRDYDIFNELTYDELILLLKEFKLKIPYYKNITKKELIYKIINYK